MDINARELKAKLDQNEDFLLIDVREPYEHDEFNIGGQLIPLGSLPQRVSELDAHKDSEVVVYCRSGSRSGMAKDILQKNGFAKVRNLTGGMMGWISEFGAG